MGQQPISSTVQAVELGLRLRERREQLGLTASSVGKQTGIGGNNLSSIEIAKRRLTSTKLAELAKVYELPDEEQHELEVLRSHTERREWWHDYTRLYSEDFLRFIGLEAGATQLREYAAETIPGLLQTADYARAMIRGGSPYIKPVEVGPRVESRLARQNRLADTDPAQFTVVIGQTALRQEVGGREVMQRQLDRLSRAVQDESMRVDIRVVPYSAGAHPVIGGGLKILSFDSRWVPDMVWQEAVTTGNLIDKHHVVEVLTASFDEALDRALGREDSLAMINEIRQEMENP
ncbi:helix-turn-helix domain-containing protein [Haloactinomyces albus]|uniref:Transcriptional regulator with XRE-family HTH domain n=1 Tax=Haloactinomyces albus TaxID=1352928 RepID=A0AAE3ZGV6_9ACTN|nr:helix-turn-helix transcriptional regulator [Haloactinomyces albus]MDR7303515.1 transcriptional regulator with XRE-family HTH domain [Haloactinomyces albus]